LKTGFSLPVANPIWLINTYVRYVLLWDIKTSTGFERLPTDIIIR